MWLHNFREWLSLNPSHPHQMFSAPCSPFLFSNCLVTFYSTNGSSLELYLSLEILKCSRLIVETTLNLKWHAGSTVNSSFQYALNPTIPDRSVQPQWRTLLKKFYSMYENWRILFHRPGSWFTACRIVVCIPSRTFSWTALFQRQRIGQKTHLSEFIFCKALIYPNKISNAAQI